jgi:NADH-quinone oxidoreductase subunit L
MLPLLSGILVAFFSPRSRKSGVLATCLSAFGLVAASIVFFSCFNKQPLLFSWDWFSLGDTQLTAGVWLTSESATLLLVVTTISFFVHLYSLAYMHDDGAVRKYFMMLAWFTFAMLVLVVANNLFLLFIGWELVGFASYMLIGHWSEKPAAARAAQKAFLMNRVGDAGFIVGMMILWSQAHTLELTTLANAELGTWHTAAALCIFCGVMGKSAQFPLFTWLPDAMEGPTPASALIHAATMVAAGVYLMIRVDFLWMGTASTIVAVVGLLTALLAAGAAVVQTDMKKILAYSTVSQLGLMVIAAGLGYSGIALLHLFTHAFFKACLFLSAGSVIHALHHAHPTFDVQDIRNLGGMRKKLPFTFLSFTLSAASLAGMPFFSGFLSKDAILTSIYSSDHSGKWIFFTGVLVVSFLTAFYSTRLISKIFLGNEKLTTGLHVKEGSILMRIPLALLSGLSLWFIVSINPISFEGWLLNGVSTSIAEHASWILVVSALVVILGTVVGYSITMREKQLSSNALLNGYYIDNVIQKILVNKVLQTSSITERIDRKYVDGFIHMTVYIQVALAHVVHAFDKYIVDGAVNTSAWFVRKVGSYTKALNAGQMQGYIMWFLAITLLFVVWSLMK